MEKLKGKVRRRLPPGADLDQCSFPVLPSQNMAGNHMEPDQQADALAKGLKIRFPCHPPFPPEKFSGHPGTNPPMIRRSPLPILQPGAGDLSNIMKKGCQKYLMPDLLRKGTKLLQTGQSIADHAGMGHHILFSMPAGILHGSFHFPEESSQPAGRKDFPVRLPAGRPRHSCFHHFPRIHFFISS